MIVSLVFVSLSPGSSNIVILYGGCMSISIFLHYFTLVAVLWMGAEALLMFRKVVIVFVRITTKYLIIIALICWRKLLEVLFIEILGAVLKEE